MEVHRSQHRITSLGALLAEAGIITLGVLIALAFDGVTSYAHHRALVREARANIASEIRDNQKELGHTLQIADAERKNLTDALDVADRLLAGKSVDSASVSLNFNLAELSEASKNTADLTGALGYMDYGEVKNYASAYEMQEQFVHLQSQILDVFIPLLNVINSGALDKNKPDEIRVWRRQLVVALSYLQARDSIAQALAKRYTHALGGA